MTTEMTVPLCRICCVSENLVNIFEEEENIANLIKNTTSIEVQPTDIVTTICSDCLRMLEAYNVFKSKAINLNNILNALQECDIIAPGTPVNKIEDYIRKVLNAHESPVPDESNNDVTEEASVSPSMPIAIQNENDSEIVLLEDSMFEVITISNGITYRENEEIPSNVEETSCNDDKNLNDVPNNDDSVSNNETTNVSSIPENSDTDVIDSIDSPSDCRDSDDIDLKIKLENSEITITKEVRNVNINEVVVKNEPESNLSDDDDVHEINKIIVAEFGNSTSETSASDLTIRLYEPSDDSSNGQPPTDGENLNNETENSNTDVNDQNDNIDGEPTTSSVAQEPASPKRWLHMLNATPSSGNKAVGFAVAIKVNEHNVILDKKLQATPIVSMINCCLIDVILCPPDDGGTKELDVRNNIQHLTLKDEDALTVAERVKLRKDKLVKKCYKVSKTYKKSRNTIKKTKNYLQQANVRNTKRTLRKLSNNVTALKRPIQI